MSDTLQLFEMSRTIDHPGFGVRVVRDLTKTEVEEYRPAVAAFFEFAHWHLLIDVVEENYRELTQSFDDVSKFRPKFDPKMEMVEVLQLTVNRRLFNLLSSARLYLDHTELRLKRRYGNVSPEANAFKEATSIAYDRAFAYRFLYRLRNFAQHCGMPVGGIQAAGTVDSSTGHEVHSLTYWLETDQLLEDGKDKWGPLRAELASAPKRLFVAELVDAAMDELRAIDRRVLEIEHPRLTRAAKSILAITSEVGPNYMPQVGSVEPNGDGLRLHFEDVPLTMMARLGFINVAGSVAPNAG